MGRARYDGRAALSTWVITVARSRSLDALRREYGRRRPPKWLASLTPRDQRIYELAFIEFRSVPYIVDRLDREGLAIPERELDACVKGLVDRLDPASRRRLDYDREARNLGYVSGRLLEALDVLRLQQSAAAEEVRPDSVLFAKQAEQLLEEVKACLLALDEPDREILVLRYYEALSAPDIARRLDLPTSRSAYRLVEKALRSLRRLVLEVSDDPERRRWKEAVRRSFRGY